MFKGKIDHFHFMVKLQLQRRTRIHFAFSLNSPLSSNADNTTGSTSTGVSSLGRLVVASLSKVIGTGVDNNGSSNDGLGSDKREL